MAQLTLCSQRSDNDNGDELLSANVDPSVTANVYCGPRMDEVLAKGIAPLWTDFRATHEPTASLWIMRYRRCGEHLKVRAYVSSSQVETFKQAFLEVVRPLVTSSLEQKSTNTQLTGPSDIPIDNEDRSKSNYDIGRVLWTHYNRSHVTFGPGPGITDDRYIRLFSDTLVAACEDTLQTFATSTTFPVSYVIRAKLLMKLVIHALRSADLGPDSAEYLRYHRDWLVRFVLLKSGRNLGSHEAVIDHFAVQARRRWPRWQGIIAECGAAEQDMNYFDAWGRSVSAILQYVSSADHLNSAKVDFYTSKPVYPVLFKVLHGAANQVGLPLLEEANIYQVLLPDTHDPA